MYVPKIHGRTASIFQQAVVVGFFVKFFATYFVGDGDAAKLSGPVLEKPIAYNVERGWCGIVWSELVPATWFFSLLLMVAHPPLADVEIAR